jgi:hypothetical protein
LSESKSHSCNELRAESATESADELEVQPLSEPKSESAGQSAIDSWGESASHLQDESAGDSWNDLPSAVARDGSISVRHSVSRSGANTVRDGDNREAAVRDVEVDARVSAITEEWSGAHCNVRGFGRRSVASPRGDSLRSFVGSPAQSFRTSIHRSAELRVTSSRCQTRPLLNVGVTSRAICVHLRNLGLLKKTASRHSERSEESSR